jgi:uracil-DNA glycosylase
MTAAHPFDSGPARRPFSGLAADYPGAEAYPPADFRIEWGPVFHRGRLDGSPLVLVLGQDPGQHECIARRILVGEAGQRVQGFLRKLGVDRSYVMVNAFLYSVYGQSGGERHVDSEPILRYRNRWLDALLDGERMHALVAFGHLAHSAFDQWAATQPERAGQLAVEKLTHPTMPEASSHGDPELRREATKRMLDQWNGALERLDDALPERDAERPLELYGDDLIPDDRAQIPEADLPAGSPPWMRSLRTWASRKGDDDEDKRATIEVVVPRDERPWHEV